MTVKPAGNRWRLILMVTLVGLVAATSWFALTGQAPGNFAPRPPWLGDPSQLPDVVPIRDNTGTIIGWTYIEQVPVDLPSDEVPKLPAHIKAKIERGEFPVVWVERPGVTTTFTADGGEHTHINDDVATLGTAILAIIRSSRPKPPPSNTPRRSGSRLARHTRSPPRQWR